MSKPFTLQDIFDKVVKHLLTQNKRATEKPDVVVCSYRTTDGLKCAIGCLVTDECYNPIMERKPVHDPVVLDVLKCSGVDGLDDVEIRVFLHELQRIHDVRSPYAWRMYLERLADAHNLQFNPP